MLPSDPCSDKSATALEIARGWRDQGFGVVIATVIATWGSSPRAVGSQLVVRDDGRFEGSVSGGCVEGDVIRTSQEVIESNKSQILKYGVSDEQAWDVGLACGGEIQIYVEPLE